MKNIANKLMKIFNIVVNDNDETGMDFISLVEAPAVEVNFLKFEKEQPIQMHFDASKHIITGVVCLADTPIYRFDMRHGEYYVVFTKDVIEKMVQKYAKHQLMNSVDLQHNEKAVSGVYMVESYIVNKDRNIAPIEFADAPDGSWICSFYVENADIWNEIENGKSLNGFSLSGMFELEEQFSKQEKPKDDDIDKLIDELLQ